MLPTTCRDLDWFIRNLFNVFLDSHGDVGEADGVGTEAAAESRERRPRRVRVADPRDQRGQSEASAEESKAQVVE